MADNTVEKIKEGVQIIPEGFYDLMVYITPSAILITGLNGMINGFELIKKIKDDLNNESVIYEILVAIIILGIL